MGVTGLWQVLEPVGRPVRLETLEGKVLAVDVSIWLHQALKGMRDRDGNPVQNAHLISLFNKVCKLLFYRIKPIFVFDGGVPALKKKTLAGRKEKKEQAERESQKTAKKMMSNFLKSYALQQLRGGNTDSISLPFAAAQTEPDLFELPPLPIRKDDDTIETDSSEDELYQSHLQNLNDVDIESADFKNLPSELQHEILTEMKETRKSNFWATMEELPQDSTDYSTYQIKKLLNQSKLSSRIEDVRKEMNERQTGVITQGLGDDYYGTCDVETRRVVSDDTSHYILIKGLAKKRKQHAMAMKKEEERLNDLRKYFEDIEDKEDNTLHSPGSELDQSNYRNGEQKKMTEIYEAEEPQPSTSGLQLKQADFHMDKGVVVVLDEDSDEDMMEDNTNQSDSKEIMNWVKATQCQGSNETEISMAAGKAWAERGIEAEGSVSSGKTNTILHVEKVSSEENTFDSEVKSVRTVTYLAHKTGQVMQNGGVPMETTEGSDSRSRIVPMEGKDVNLNQHVEKTLDKDEKNLQNLAQQNTIRQYSDILIEKEADAEDFKSVQLSSHGSEGIISNGEVIKTCLVGSRSSSDRVTPAPSEPVSPVNHLSSKEIGEETSPKPVLTGPLTDESDVNRDGAKTGESARGEGTVSEPIVVPDEEDSDDDGGEFVEIPEMSGDVTFSRSLSEVRDYAEGSNVIPTETTEEKIEEDKKVGENFRAQLEELTEEGYQDFQYELQEEAMTLQTERGKQARLAVSIGDQIYAEAQELLRLFGLPYLVSPMEAEAQCAYLDLSGQTHGTITDDSDVWLFGGRRVYKNFFNKGKLVEFFKIEDCMSQFGLDRDKLINIALLCGSDYTYGIRGVGPVTGMEIMAEFPGQEQEGLKAFKKWWRRAHREPAQMSDTKLLTKLRQVSLPGGFPDRTVVEAYQNPEVDQSQEAFTWGMPELDSIRDFTQERLGWTRVKTDEILLPVLKQLNKPSTQGRITSFFSPEIHRAVSREPQSKRMKKSQQRMKGPQSTAVNSSEKVKKTVRARSSAKPPVKKVLKKVCLSESSSSNSESESDLSADESQPDYVTAAMFDDEFEEDFQQTQNKMKTAQNSKKKITKNSKGKPPVNKTKSTVSKSAAAKEKTVPKKSKYTKRALSSHMPL